MYSIRIRIEGIEKRKRSVGLLHMVIGFFLIVKMAAFYRINNYQSIGSALPFLLIGGFSVFYGAFRKNIDLPGRFNSWLRILQAIAFSVLGLLLIHKGSPIDLAGIFVFVILSLLLFFSERRIFAETILFLKEEGVSIPGDYRQHLVTWDNLKEVVVREDFITIFHRKQKYLQFQVHQDLSTLEVAKMNAFFKEKIEQVAQVQINNN
jgi:hypothetical protein